MKAQSIYIHIPFCKTKCPYCDFATWAEKEHLIEQYFNALISEIQSKCDAYIDLRSQGLGDSGQKLAYNSLLLGPIKTIYIGGGTPSLISPEYYKKLFKELRSYFSIEKDCEITLELNPGTAKKDYLSAYKDLGINRISIGAQSFDEEILKILGRVHTVEDILEAVNMVKSQGLDNFSLDLIYSVPHMTEKIWTHSINKTLDLNPKHISAYALTTHSRTPFAKIYQDKRKLPGEDFSSKLYNILCKILAGHDFVHYEISNFAKRGFESRHNLAYWLGKEYYAFGVSAHRYLNGIRSNNLKSLESYIMSPNLETITECNFSHDLEKIILQSRLNTGFEFNLLEKTSTKTSKELKTLLLDLQDEGLVEVNTNKVHLSEKGMFLNNEILLRLM